MTPNVLLSRSEADLKRHFNDDFIAHIDGNKAVTFRQFYVEIADWLEIPDFGFSLEDLNDALNDLQWLEDERVVLYITDTVRFVSKERDPAKIGSLLNVLDATAEDWKWLDDDETADRKELIVVFEDSPRIRQLLDKEQIDYALLSEMG